MAPNKKFTGAWRRPFTVVYGDNYDYGFNSYGDVMHWLDDKKKGTEKPAPKKYTLEDYVDQHFRFRYGRQLVNDLKEDPSAVSQRLEHIKKASEEVDRRHKGLSRSHTFNAIGRSVSEIEEDLRLDAATSLEDGAGETWRHPLRYSGFLDGPGVDHDTTHLRNLQEHRRKIAEEIAEESAEAIRPHHSFSRRHPLHHPTTNASSAAATAAAIVDQILPPHYRTMSNDAGSLEGHLGLHQTGFRSRADHLLSDISAVERNLGGHDVRTSHLDALHDEINAAENASISGVRARDNPRKWYSFPPHFYCVPLKKR